MANMNNFGFITGRLTKDPAVFANSDGSKKIKVTVAAQDNFKGKDGNRGTQFVDLEAFVSAKSAKNAFDYMNKGDLVSFGYTVRTNNFEDKNGNMHYGQVLLIQDTELRETKKSKEARANGDIAGAAAAAGATEAPAVAEDDAPFAE